MSNIKFYFGDIAYFYQNSINEYEYAWKLNNYQKVIIENRAFDNKGNIFYSIKTLDNTILSWYSEKHLLTDKEVRKYKITKIKSIYTI